MSFLCSGRHTSCPLGVGRTCH